MARAEANKAGRITHQSRGRLLCRVREAVTLVLGSVRKGSEAACKTGPPHGLVLTEAMEEAPCPRPTVRALCRSSRGLTPNRRT